MKSTQSHTAGDAAPASSRPALCTVLGLRPLDRVQINSRREITECTAFARFTNTPQDLPWWFFQRVVGDMLEVRSPGGYAALVTPQDICDVIQSTPIRTLAMPRANFIARLRNRSGGSAHHDDSNAYAPASVLHATKNRWGQAEFRVLFDDESFNDSATWIAPIATAEHARRAPLGCRRNMPVSGSRGASYSADAGQQTRHDFHKRVATVFVQAARAGRRDIASTLAAIGNKPLSLAQINRLAVSA